jgi:hypothetical protein
MTFDVRLGLNKLPKDGGIYSILISDTVLISDTTEVLSSKCTKKLDDVSTSYVLVLESRFLTNWIMNLL